MKWYAIKAFGFLIWSEFQMKLQNGGSVLQNSQLRGSSRRAQVQAASKEELCRAMDIACFLYPKRVLCLQRVAATRALLALHRIEAKVVVGVRVALRIYSRRSSNTSSGMKTNLERFSRSGTFFRSEDLNRLIPRSM